MGRKPQKIDEFFWKWQEKARSEVGRMGNQPLPPKVKQHIQIVIRTYRVHIHHIGSG